MNISRKILLLIAILFVLPQVSAIPYINIRSDATSSSGQNYFGDNGNNIEMFQSFNTTNTSDITKITFFMDTQAGGDFNIGVAIVGDAGNVPNRTDTKASNTSVNVGVSGNKNVTFPVAFTPEANKRYWVRFNASTYSLSDGQIKYSYDNGGTDYTLGFMSRYDITTNSWANYTSSDFRTIVWLSDPVSMPDNVTFIGRYPNDITETNLFNFIPQYNYSYNNTGLTVPYAVSVISSVLSCVHKTNDTCVLLNGTNVTKSPLTNVTVGGLSNFSYNFSENDIYPTIENINYTSIIAYGVTNSTITNNQYYADEIPGISNKTQYNIYEIPARSTSSFSVYYYNNSYDFASSPLTNTNVINFCTINSNSYNHSHNIVSHNLCPFTINGSGFIGDVYLNGGGFIVRGNNLGVVLTSANTVTRSDAARLSTNSGNSWTNQANTLASHVHQFSGVDTFCVKGMGNYSGNFFNTTNNCDTLQITPFAPTVPNIHSPMENQTFGRFINVTWDLSNPNYDSSYIVLYNVTLHNADQTLNRTINTTSNTTTTYNIDSFIYGLNISVPYIVRVEAVDNNAFRSFAFSDTFNLASNAEINVFARNIFGNTTITNMTNYTISGVGFSNYTNNTNGNTTFYVINGSSYNLTIKPEGFAQNNITINVSSTINNVYSMHYRKNTVNFTFYDENTRQKINGVQIELIGTSTQYNYSSATSTILAELLSPETYSTVSTSSGYYSRTGLITVGDYSYQEQAVYLLNSSVTTNIQTLLTVTDRANNPVIGATLTIEILQGTSFVTVQSRQTDFSGSAVLSLDSSKIYRITAWKSGYYQTQTQIQPSQTAYTIRIDAVSVQNNVNIYSRAAFSYTPVNSTINQSQNTFTFVTTATDGYFVFFGLEANGQKDNRTSPTGGTASITLDLSAYNNRPLVVEYFYQFSDGSKSRFNRSYYVTNSTISGDSIMGVTERLGIGTGGKILFGIAIVIIALVTFAIFLPPGALAFIAVGLFIFLWAIGLFPAYITALFILIMVFGIIIKER